MTTINELLTNFKNLVKKYHYTKTEVDTALANKAGKDTATASTNGLMSAADKSKLDSISGGTIVASVDSALSDSSTNPVQNQVITAELSEKVNSSELSDVAFSGEYSDLDNIPLTFTPSTHSHNTTQMIDETAHSNLNTAVNATQAAINTAIDSKIGSLLSVELITIASTRPTASASTMNKLYLIPESSSETDDAYEVFVTYKNGNNYAWEKIDTARLDLSEYYTKTEANNTFVKSTDFVNELNTAISNLINEE